MHLARLIMAAMTIAGCSAPQLNPDVPALRTSDSAASKTEIEQILATAMNGRSVTIAEDALMQRSTLILEQETQQRIGSPREPGRNYGRPDHFQLVLDGRRCFLVHEETGLRWMLKETTCEAE